MRKLSISAEENLYSLTKFNPHHHDAYANCLTLLERAGVPLTAELRRALKQAGQELGLIPVEEVPKKDRSHLRIVVSN